MAHGEAHVADHILGPLIGLRHGGAGHGADHRIGPVPDGDAQGGGNFVSIAVGEGKARLQQAVRTALIQRLVQGKDVVTFLPCLIRNKGQGEHILAVDAAADAVTADADDNGLAAAGEPLQARLAGIEADINQRIAAGGDIEIPGQGLTGRPVAVLHQGERNGVDLGQGAVGDLDIEGAEIALVAVKIGALHLQPQVDAVGAHRLIQHAVELHMVLAVQIQGDGQHRLATRIQQGDLVAINLIAGRLAAAGEGAEAGLIGLEVQGHQAVAAHIDRQLTVQGLAGPALLQADAGV
ncbi:hypothetical protein D3C84_312830 [compost metagenome]